jgi:phage recombination protein Bet
MNSTGTMTTMTRGDGVPDPTGEVYAAIAAVRRTLAPDLDDTELRLFALVAQRLRLDPFAGQIYAVKRRTRHGERVAFQTSIDGFRTSAEETGEYRGSDEPEYGDWIAAPFGHPEWARVTVHRQLADGTWIHQSSGQVHWSEFYPGDESGYMWKSKPRLMLAKCAEAQAFRKAFPKRFSGVYAPEELAQSDEPATPARPMPTARERLDAQRARLVPATAPVAPPAPPPDDDPPAAAVIGGDLEVPDPMTADALRAWLRERLISPTEALVAARVRWGDDAHLTELTDQERGELRTLLERARAA